MLRRQCHAQHSRSAPLIGFWIPKRAGQTEQVEDRYHFVGRRPTRFDSEPVRVPMNGELPQLLEIHEGPSRNVVRRAPLIDGLSRPEEEHRCSSETEIVPPMRRRAREMRDVRFQNRRAGFYFERQRFARMTIRSAADRITVQRSCDPVSVPHTVRVILLPIRFDWKPSRHARKWRRHSNSLRIARLWKKKT